MAHLTKSRYISGLQCLRRLWLSVYEPLPWEEPDAGSVLDVGQRIGLMAHTLFPGGVLVDQMPWEHTEAVGRTKALMADRSVPAIFEAAFDFDDIRIRVDVLERKPKGAWGLVEVKSSGSIKDYHLDDVAIQSYVLKQSGIKLSSIAIMHVNKDYVRGSEGIHWPDFFTRSNVKAEAKERSAAIEELVAEQQSCLRRRKPPRVEPGRHCGTPVDCEFWDRCTADKPADWVFYLPRITERTLTRLAEAGIERVTEIPDDFPLTGQQSTIRNVLLSGSPYISSDLGRLLANFGPPALYLDFEAAAPAIPLYAGTQPFQTLVFQWSLHALDRDGVLSHQEFLAIGDVDPRRQFIETLIDATKGNDWPIVV